MAVEKLLRVEAIIPSKPIAYFSNNAPSITERFLLGFFSDGEVAEVVDCFKRSGCYDWRQESLTCDDQNVVVVSLNPSKNSFKSECLVVLRRSLEKPDLTIQQVAELVLEMAKLGVRLEHICTKDGWLLGYYPSEYAESRWGALKRDRRTRKCSINDSLSQESRYELLSSQLMAPNYDCLRLRMQKRIAGALKYILRERLRKEGHLTPNEEEVFRRALSYGEAAYSVSAKSGSFVGYFTGLQAYDNWRAYEIDEATKSIVLTCELSDKDRQGFLLEALMNDQLKNATHTLAMVDELRQLGINTDEVTIQSFSERRLPDSMPLLSSQPRNPDWNSLFRRIRDYYATFDHDYVAGSMVLKQLRSHFGDNISEGYISFIQRAIEGTGSDAVTLGDKTFGASQLLTLALIGHQEATEKLATILLKNAEKSTWGKRSRSGDQRKENESATEKDAIPDWAKPQKSAIEQWAEKTRALTPRDYEGNIAAFIAGQVGKGKLNVLVFELELYEEIRGAEIAGERTSGIESFPFPMAFIPLGDSSSILGVAVFKLDQLPNTIKGGKAFGGEFGSVYLLKDGGATLNPEPPVFEVGDKLITYLDCESVQFDTVYVDGGKKTRDNAPSIATDAADVEYVRGADFNTGNRIVVERDGSKRIVAKPIGTRRSHFRRGFFRRQRVGTQNDWHYEMRWIKPTYVHGSQAIVTERKVKRVVL